MSDKPLIVATIRAMFPKTGAFKGRTGPMDVYNPGVFQEMHLKAIAQCLREHGWYGVANPCTCPNVAGLNWITGHAHVYPREGGGTPLIKAALLCAHILELHGLPVSDELAVLRAQLLVTYGLHVTTIK